MAGTKAFEVLTGTLLSSDLLPTSWMFLIVRLIYLFQRERQSKRDEGQEEEENKISSRLWAKRGARRAAPSCDPEIMT